MELNNLTISSLLLFVRLNVLVLYGLCFVVQLIYILRPSGVGCIRFSGCPKDNLAALRNGTFYCPLHLDLEE